MCFGVSSLLPLTTPEVETISNKHKSAQRSTINNDFSVRRTYDLHSLKNIGRSLSVNSCLPKLQPRVIKKIRELKINKKRKRGKRGSKTNVRMIKNKSVNTHNLIQLTPASGYIKNGTKGRNYSASIKFGLINTRALKLLTLSIFLLKKTDLQKSGRRSC